MDVLHGRLSAAGTGLEALKTKADRHELLLLKEAVAAISAEVVRAEGGWAPSEFRRTIPHLTIPAEHRRY